MRTDRVATLAPLTPTLGVLTVDKYLKLPANDLPTWVGLAVAVIGIIVIAKKLPVVKNVL